MANLSIGDRVRVRAERPRGRFEPAPERFFGRVGVIYDDPGDYGVKFEGESGLVYLLGEDLEALPIFFVAFGADPGLPGEYRREPLADFQAYLKTRNGFWSLVRGEHAVLVTMNMVRTSVMDLNHAVEGSKNPGQPAVGEDVVVVVPPKDFVEWSEAQIFEAERPGYQGPKMPLPLCALELWTRVK